MTQRLDFPTALVTPIEDAAAVLSSVLSSDGEVLDGQLLLAHHVDGIVWGIVQDGIWRLSGDEHPRWSPRPTADGLLLLRIFDEFGETFVWRDEDVGLVGRRLDDLPDLSTGDPLRCMDEDRLLRGDRVIAQPPEGGLFTPVADATGSRHVPPLTWEGTETPKDRPGLLRVRHYMTTDADAGCVRIAASRCVEVTKRRPR